VQALEQNRHAFGKHIFLPGELVGKVEHFRHLPAGNGGFRPVFRQAHGTFYATCPRTGNVAGYSVDLGIVIRFYDYPIIFAHPSESCIHFTDNFRAHRFAEWQAEQYRTYRRERESYSCHSNFSQ